MLCIIALTVSILGCGEEPQPSELVTREVGTDEFIKWWEVVSINAEALEKTFDDYMVTDNHVFFSHTGSFTHEVTFFRVEIYASDPETFMSEWITDTTRGRYTTRGNRLTMTKLSTQMNVDVRLEPEAAWQQQIEGMTLEALRSAKVAKIKKGLQQDIPPPLFKEDTEYTWQIENGLLTLSSPQQTIVLLRGALLLELEID